MATIAIELPEDLAERARAAGLLSAQALGALLDEALRRRAAERLLAMTEPLAAANRAVPLAEREALVEQAVRAARLRRSGT
jgi:post-segregation antitoxin (ccd killing protein)